MSISIVQLNTSPGGMPKLPVLDCEVTVDGLPGDWQNNRKYHGGPDRAVCLFSAELYDWLRTQGVDLPWGTVGENFTTRGVDLLDLGPGDRLATPDCTIEITAVRVPCRNLNQFDPRLMNLVQGRSGWVAKVTRPGFVRVGDPLSIEKINR